MLCFKTIIIIYIDKISICTSLFHKIKGGDYLYKIAMNYGVSVKDICNWNGIKRNHMLVAGREIKVSE